MTISALLWLPRWRVFPARAGEKIRFHLRVLGGRKGAGVCFKDRPEWSRCGFNFRCREAPPAPGPRHETANNETTAARTGKPEQGWASQAGPKSLNRVAIFRTKPSRGFALQRSCRGDLPNMEHDMSTSAPARVKTILVVDLTHVPNDPFSTTILRDLRARLIPPPSGRKGSGYLLERARTPRRRPQPV
jgi:hypothetical protein